MGTMVDSYYNFEDIILDEQVNDCLVKAYFSMLTSDQQDRDKYYNEFETLYKDLNEEQQEIVKKEIAKILDINYKPKVKKKERWKWQKL